MLMLGSNFSLFHRSIIQIRVQSQYWQKYKKHGKRETNFQKKTNVQMEKYSCVLQYVDLFQTMCSNNSQTRCGKMYFFFFFNASTINVKNITKKNISGT